MTIRMRSPVAVLSAAAILLFTNSPALGLWVEGSSMIEWTWSLRTEHITGAAIAVIALLLILLHSPALRNAPRLQRARRCPVCDEELRPKGRYCPTCGSRV